MWGLGLGISGCGFYGLGCRTVECERRETVDCDLQGLMVPIENHPNDGVLPEIGWPAIDANLFRVEGLRV